MGDLLIRDIPDGLRNQLEQAAKRDGKSLSAKSIDLLRTSLEDTPAPESQFVSAWDELRPLLYDGHPEDVGDALYAKIMEEVELERKSDFGRPLPDFE